MNTEKSATAGVDELRERLPEIMVWLGKLQLQDEDKTKSFREALKMPGFMDMLNEFSAFCESFIIYKDTEAQRNDIIDFIETFEEDKRFLAATTIFVEKATKAPDGIFVAAAVIIYIPIMNKYGQLERTDRAGEVPHV